MECLSLAFLKFTQTIPVGNSVIKKAKSQKQSQPTKMDQIGGHDLESVNKLLVQIPFNESPRALTLAPIEWRFENPKHLQQVKIYGKGLDQDLKEISKMKRQLKSEKSLQTVDPTDPHFDVRRIFGRRFLKRKVEYHVKYKGKGNEHSWEPLENLGNCLRKVKEFVCLSQNIITGHLEKAKRMSRVNKRKSKKTPIPIVSNGKVRKIGERSLLNSKLIDAGTSGVKPILIRDLIPKSSAGVGIRIGQILSELPNKVLKVKNPNPPGDKPEAEKIEGINRENSRELCEEFAPNTISVGVEDLQTHGEPTPHAELIDAENSFENIQLVEPEVAAASHAHLTNCPSAKENFNEFPLDNWSGDDIKMEDCSSSTIANEILMENDDAKGKTHVYSSSSYSKECEVSGAQMDTQTCSSTSGMGKLTVEKIKTIEEDGICSSSRNGEAPATTVTMIGDYCSGELAITSSSLQNEPQPGCSRWSVSTTSDWLFPGFRNAFSSPSAGEVSLVSTETDENTLTSFTSSYTTGNVDLVSSSSDHFSPQLDAGLSQIQEFDFWLHNVSPDELANTVSTSFLDLDTLNQLFPEE